MSYQRFIKRNYLQGDYGAESRDEHWTATRGLIAGDLRRLERDQRNESHLAIYANRAGITVDQAHLVLIALFDIDCEAMR